MANAAFITVDTREAARLVRKLAVLGPTLERKYVSAAARKGVSVIGKEAGRNARKDKRSGLLAKSMGVVTRKYKSGVVVAIAGPRSKKDPRTGENPANIAHLVEFPVKPHEIVPKRKGLFGLSTAAGLSNIKDVTLGFQSNPAFFGRRVEHPGFAGRPFIGPAFKSKSGEAQKVYAAELEKALRIEALKP